MRLKSVAAPKYLKNRGMLALVKSIAVHKVQKKVLYTECSRKGMWFFHVWFREDFVFE